MCVPGTTTSTCMFVCPMFYLYVENWYFHYAFANVKTGNVYMRVHVLIKVKKKKVSSNSVPQAIEEEKLKIPQPIRDKGGHLCFWIGPKNTNLLVEDIEHLLPVKFGQIPF